jgi:predicted CoA-binding protein
MQSLKPTLVIGASENPERYSYRAIQDLQKHHHPVWAIGTRQGKVGTTPIETTQIACPSIDTITLYLSSERQKPYYDYILALQPKRLIFNPGTENEALADLAKQAGINPIEACTLVLLHTGQY